MSAIDKLHHPQRQVPIINLSLAVRLVAQVDDGVQVLSCNGLPIRLCKQMMQILVTSDVSR